MRLTVGSHLDGDSQLTQCPRCDRGQHRRCIRKKHCTARKSALPNPVSLSPAVPPIPEDVETDWESVDGMWAALAADGIGHHDGDGEYVVQIPVEDFGELFFLGGEVRFEANGIDPRTIFPLPTVAPATTVTFRFKVCPEGRTGRAILVEGLEVRFSPSPPLLLLTCSSPAPHLLLTCSSPPPHLLLPSSSLLRSSAPPLLLLASSSSRCVGRRRRKTT